MNQAHHQQSSLAGFASRSLAAVTLCALTLAPAFAFGGDGRDKDLPTPGPGAGVAIGDETIGTLPIMNGGATIELVRGLPILRPSLFLEGDLYELQNAISFFQGAARAEVIPLDATWQRVRLVFVDEVLLGIDRALLLGVDIRFGVWMPDAVRCSTPNLAWGGRWFGVQPFESRLELPLSQMSATGALDASPLCVASASAVGPSALLAAVDQEFLFLVQRLGAQRH